MTGKKRIASMLLAIMLTMTMVIPTYAVSSLPSDELDYAVNRVERFLEKENYDAVADLSLSNPIPLHNLDSNGEKIGNVYFAFDGTKNIASLLVSSHEDQYDSSFYMSNYEAVNQALLNEENIVLGSINDCFLLFSNGNMHILENPNHYDTVDTDNSMLIEGTRISQIVELSILPKGKSVYYNLSVPFVDNDSSPLSGYGLCWAACLASKINYQQGKSLTAMDIWRACWKTVAYDDATDPMGTDEWVKTAGSLYNINIQVKSGQMNTSQITQRLRLENPAIAVIYGKNNKNESVSHAILLNSFDEDADYYEVSFMDPNVGNSYVYISFSHSNLDSGKGFSYNTTWGSKYTSWGKSWY